MASKTGNAFDFDLFKRLLKYTNPYKVTFYFVAVAAILLSFFAVLRPYLLKVTVDDAITPQNYDNLVFYVGLMAGVLVLEVIFQFLFVYLLRFFLRLVLVELQRLFVVPLAFLEQLFLLLLSQT